MILKKYIKRLKTTDFCNIQSSSQQKIDSILYQTSLF